METIDKKIYCIIPAYNEEKKIAAVIEGVKQYVDEVVVVDDGSSDDTYDRAKRTGATVLKHIVNRGQGAALATGNSFALESGAAFIVHFDADGQFRARDIVRIVEPLTERRAQVVFGSRFLSGNPDIPGIKKNLLLPLAHAVNKIMAGATLTDPQSGFRAMTAEAARLITIENDGAAHCSEIIHKVIRGGYTYTEVPITVVYNEFGQSVFGGKGRGMGGLRILKDLIIAKFLN